MKYSFLTSCLLLGITLFSCNINTGEPQKTDKYLFHPKKQEIDLEGSVLIVDNGIMVLVQNGPLKEIPTILIPANDSAKTVLKNSYQDRLDNSYIMGEMPWVKLAGNFIREDSLKPIFKFTWVELMDKGTELKQIEEMEE
jgi:hypothetical protein